MKTLEWSGECDLNTPDYFIYSINVNFLYYNYKKTSRKIESK